MNKEIQLINRELEIIAKKQLELAKFRISQEEQDVAARALLAEQTEEYNAAVDKVINNFDLLDKIYVDEAVKSYGINGIELELMFKPSGLVGVKLHFANRNIDISNTSIFDKLGQAIRYFFDLGIPLLCDVPMSFKSIVLTITKDNTNDTIPAHIDGPEFLFVYTKNNLEQRTKLKKLKISVDRRISDAAGFEFKGKLIASDVNSLTDLNVITNYVAVNGELPATLTEWKAIDNTYVSVDGVDDWKELVSALSAHFHENFVLAQAKKEALVTVETQEQLDAVDTITI